MESSNQNSIIIPNTKDIKVDLNIEIKSIIDYSIYLMKQKEQQEIRLSAIGSSIGKLIEIVEILKLYLPGIYQNNRLATICYESINLNEKTPDHLYPKLEITLSKKEPIIKNEGYQGALQEEMRIIIEKYFNKERKIKLRSRTKSNMIKKVEDKEKFNIFLKIEIESKLNDFVNQIQIKQFLDK